MSRHKRATLSLELRACGLLLHPTSLPGGHGIGDLGAEARAFVDFLAAGGQTWWQMLPTQPTGEGNSPYSATSAFAGNPLLISLDQLVDDGLLRRRDVAPVRGFRADRVSYGIVRRYKLARLRRAFDAWTSAGGAKRREFSRFCDRAGEWLDGDAMFMALRRAHADREWIRWPEDLCSRKPAAIRKAGRELAEAIDFERFVQFVFDRQWAALRRYANDRRVGLIGDVPIFVAHDSSDVWARRDLFDLYKNGRARTVSGVPPDLFSKTGQRWGHPQYRWARHRSTGFSWWVSRFGRAMEQFDAVRIDHFLGFNRVWAVPGRAKTAKNGRWIKTPGDALFTTLRKRLGRLEIIAEDLGLLVPEAAVLRDKFGFPGMRLLQFAFGDDRDHYHEPHAHVRNSVAYTGTHDNNTLVGWFEELAAGQRKRRPKSPTPYERFLRYTGGNARGVHWDAIRLVQMSVANTAIVPVQDILGLDGSARMNTPGTATGNWQWRLRKNRLTNRLAERLRELAVAYGRIGE